MTYPMHQWATDLFPIHRSLTGEGVRETLRYLQQLLPGLTIHEVPSGTRAFDWTVPKEWVCREAYVENTSMGNRVIDIKNSNLHVVQYSAPFEGFLSGAQLDEHLHSLPSQPDAIPYVTSYYKETWGFCVSQRQRDEFIRNKNYRVVIDSELKDGHLTYGELIIPGAEATEVLLSTNICHPSMGNNELSGPVVVTALAQWLASEPRRHTYRILFLPETIGALVYLSRVAGDPARTATGANTNAARMKEHTIAGYQVVCCGDTKRYSYLPSRQGETLADRAARKAFKDLGIQLWGPKYLPLSAKDNDREYSFAQDRGSDERQWCAPGVDLPVGSIMRSKYDTYPEYHTSLDDLNFISQEGLEGSLKVYQHAIDIIEANRVYKYTKIGEPQISKYDKLAQAYEAGTTAEKLALLNIPMFSDGTNDLIALAEISGVDVVACAKFVEIYKEYELLE